MPTEGDRIDEIGDAVWVAVDVAMEALGISQRRVYQLAKQEGWRTAAGHYPKQFLFQDVRTTYLKRKATP
jgi:hypothetical protein